MVEKTPSQKHDELIGYILSQLTEDVDEIKDDIEKLKERLIILEKEDKRARLKIVILLIVLIFSYITAEIPKIISILETLGKYV